MEGRGYNVFGLDRYQLNDPIQMNDIVCESKPDYVVHLAAYGNHYTQQDDFEILRVNIDLTHKLLDATKFLPYKAFVNVSSSSVYGSKPSTMHERDLPETDTLYGATKLASEYICRAFGKKYDKPVITVRPFSVYGKGEASHRFIPTIIRSILGRETMKLDPNPRHDWINVVDFCEGLTVIMENISRTNDDVFNIGTGKQYTNMEVVEKLEWILNRKAKYELTSNMRVFDTNSWVADISRVQKLGWQPSLDIMTGLRKTLNGRISKSKKAGVRGKFIPAESIV